MKIAVSPRPINERMIPAFETEGCDADFNERKPVTIPERLITTVMYQAFHIKTNDDITDNVPKIRERTDIVTSKVLIIVYVQL